MVTPVVFGGPNGGTASQPITLTALDPSNPRILYAAFWQVERRPWTIDSGGPESGLYKSTDGGDTWKHIEGNGLPTGIVGSIGVTVSGADSKRVYAISSRLAGAGSM